MIPPILDTSTPIYREIVDNALVVTGCPLVNINLYDPATEMVSLGSIAGLDAPLYQSALRRLGAALPNLATERLSVSVHANPLTASVYTDAVVVDLSWRQLGEGILDGPVLDFIESITGLSRAVTYPIVVRGHVLASLCFHGTSPFTPENRKVFDFFVRQTALTLENAYLLAESRQYRQLTTASEERLRREIAELLHSRVQSKLLVVWHRLGDVHALIESDPTRAKGLLADLRKELDRIRENDVREASHLLHPSIIRVGLIPAVRSLARRFEDYFRLSLVLDPRVVALDNPMKNDIPESARLVAYRVIEEALSNAYRHSRARLVELRIDLKESDRLAIAVSDDGIGYDPETMKPGLGLTSIAGRIEQVGGTWEISGRPSEGAILRAEFRFSALTTEAVNAIPAGVGSS